MGDKIIIRRAKCETCKRLSNANPFDDPSCPHCGARGSVLGGWGSPVKVRGEKVPTIGCDALCTQAIGTACRCSCGGMNHGMG